MSERLDCAYEDARGHDGAGATRHMALVCAASSSAADSSGSGAADLLLSDLHDALLAYTRLSTFERDEPAYPSFVTMELAGETMRVNMPLEADEDICCDTVVLALELPEQADHEPLAGALRTLARSGVIKPNTCVYAIICDSGTDGGSGVAQADEAACTCEQIDAHWCGAVVVTDALLVPRLMRAPRLGMWRRPVARAIDRIVAAVRMSCALDELDELLGVDPQRANTSNVLVASPHPLWHAIASRMR